MRLLSWTILSHEVKNTATTGQRGLANVGRKNITLTGSSQVKSSPAKRMPPDQEMESFGG